MMRADIGRRRQRRGAGPVACGQRVRNTQPDGGLTGLGMSPASRMREAARAGPGTGAADSRGREYRVAAGRILAGGATFHPRPRYITDFVAQVVHHRQVVGHEQHGQAQVALQVLQQVQHLRTDTSSAETGSSAT